MVTIQSSPMHSQAPSRALRGLEERLAGSNAGNPNVGTALDSAEIPADGRAPVDYQQLRQRLRGGDAVVRRILSLFPDECAGGLAELQRSITARRWDEAAELAHRLKGAAGTIAAADLRLAASAVEEACRRQERDSVQTTLLDLFHEALRATEYVRTILTKP